MSQVSRLLRETKDLIRYVELDVKILPEIVAERIYPDRGSMRYTATPSGNDSPAGVRKIRRRSAASVIRMARRSYS